MGYILITGSSGFIGRNLLHFIENKYNDQLNKIVLLSNFASSRFITIPHTNYQFTSTDFINKGILDIEAVIHIGAFTPKDSSSANFLDENYSNILNTMFLVKNLPSKPKKFIFISTLDVYEPTKQIIDELTPTLPITFYGNCKLFCEKLVLHYCNSNSIVPHILRLGHIYGRGRKHTANLYPKP